MESRTRAMVEAMSDLCFVISRDGRYLEAYTSDDEKLALPREVFLGKTIEETLGGELASKAREAIDRALETRRLQVFEYELPLRGQYRQWEARVVRHSPEDV